MSIKPVDFQVMIPRTMEVARTSSDENQRNFAMQHQQAASAQHNAESTLKQVYSQKRPQEAGISRREKDNSGRERKKKGGSEERKKNLQTSTIDIKV